MSGKLTAKQSISIKAPEELVWNALTKPELIKKYFFGTETTTDWEVGSPILYEGVWEGKPYVDKGTVLEVEKYKLIRYSYWSSFSGTPDTPEHYNTITYKLEDQHGEVVYSVVQEGVTDEAARKHSEENWKVVMEGMKKLIEEELLQP